MDEKLSKALEFANYTRTFNDQRRLLKEKFIDSMIYFTAGGQFTVTPGLISFVNILLETNDSAVLLDDNENPINVEDLKKFSIEILDLYFQNTNEYYQSLHNLKSKRSIEKLVEYE